MMSGYVKLTEKNSATPKCLHQGGFEIYTSNLIEIHLFAKLFVLKLAIESAYSLMVHYCKKICEM